MKFNRMKRATDDGSYLSGSERENGGVDCG